MQAFNLANACPDSTTLKLYCDRLQEDEGAENCDVYGEEAVALDAQCDDSTPCHDTWPNPTISAYRLVCEYGEDPT
jgi:hypothetical protein